MSDAIPPQINDLLDRRATYIQWLARLDEVGEEARQEVVERIRADYESRLREVRSELGDHHDELADSLEDRTSRVGGLEEEREEQLARREEAEIRHKVGEYDEDEWETRRQELDRSIQELERELDRERDAISELETALEAMEEPPAAAPAPEGVAGTLGSERPRLTLVEDEGEAEAQESAGEEPESVTAGEEEAASRERDAGPGDEAGTAAPAEDTSPESPERESRPERPESESREREAPDGAYDELEFLESLSLEDADQFDAVSAMLEEGEEEAEEEGERPRDEEGGREDEGSSRPSPRGDGG